ncbi:MafI family immunity protein [Pseudovibrio exalbescens]|uniref:MafI family immunity protein n=1 Tax=Pseudovibrio exalbescens TaxID=197461 RepID=UPI0023652CD1|nr:MafI family immunity protein [Pseudovibrio exalbescens]MDD7912010.1 MafI family immunity protein [Pseudovibrio exalbescens]
MENEIQRTIISLIQRFRGRLADELLDDYQSTAEHGEWGVAFENLCEQLFEFDVFPSEQEFQNICELGESMKIDPQKWCFLAPPKS